MRADAEKEKSSGGGRARACPRRGRAPSVIRSSPAFCRALRFLRSWSARGFSLGQLRSSSSRSRADLRSSLGRAALRASRRRRGLGDVQGPVLRQRSFLDSGPSGQAQSAMPRPRCARSSRPAFPCRRDAQGGNLSFVAARWTKKSSSSLRRPTRQYAHRSRRRKRMVKPAVRRPSLWQEGGRRLVLATNGCPGNHQVRVYTYAHRGMCFLAHRYRKEYSYSK